MHRKTWLGFAAFGAVLVLVACDDVGTMQVAAAETGSGSAIRPVAQQQAMQQQAQPRQQMQQGQNQGLPPDALRVTRVEIIDRTGFERPTTAATMMIPAGWQAQGGVVWNPQAQCSNGYNYQWNATAPDGSMGLALIPSFTWATNSMGVPSGGCPNLQLNSVQAYLQYLVQQTRPNARILDFRPREDLLKGTEGLVQHDRSPMGEFRTWFEAGEVLIGYTANGREMRETAAAMVMFSHNRMSDGLGGVMEYMTGSALPGYAFFAPNGQLDFKMAEMLRQTFRPAPEWTARIAQHNRKIARTNLEGARKRSQIIARTGEEIRQMQQESWERQRASDDRMQREVTESIRGTETYNDSSVPGGTVELSNMYENAWRMPDNTYVLTDDAFFSPADGVKLEPTP